MWRLRIKVNLSLRRLRWRRILLQKLWRLHLLLVCRRILLVSLNFWYLLLYNLLNYMFQRLGKNLELFLWPGNLFWRRRNLWFRNFTFDLFWRRCYFRLDHRIVCFRLHLLNFRVFSNHLGLRDIRLPLSYIWSSSLILWEGSVSFVGSVRWLRWWASLAARRRGGWSPAAVWDARLFIGLGRKLWCILLSDRRGFVYGRLQELRRCWWILVLSCCSLRLSRLVDGRLPGDLTRRSCVARGRTFIHSYKLSFINYTTQAIISLLWRNINKLNNLIRIISSIEYLLDY